jgi:hypothetical protein
MAQVLPLPIDLNDPKDREVASWLAEQADPANAVKRLILEAAANEEAPRKMLDLVPLILREVRTIRAEMSEHSGNGGPEVPQDEVIHELRALRADLARVGPKELGRVSPPPEDPDSAHRLDTLFSRQ